MESIRKPVKKIRYTGKRKPKVVIKKKRKKVKPLQKQKQSQKVIINLGKRANRKTKLRGVNTSVIRPQMPLIIQQPTSQPSSFYTDEMIRLLRNERFGVKPTALPREERILGDVLPTKKPKIKISDEDTPLLGVEFLREMEDKLKIQEEKQEEMRLAEITRRTATEIQAEPTAQQLGQRRRREEERQRQRERERQRIEETGEGIQEHTQVGEENILDTTTQPTEITFTQPLAPTTGVEESKTD
tara:strand:+ start:6395 stop:7123 length:729 start_codon:yes stop_codon:yes gene_type:complete